MLPAIDKANLSCELSIKKRVSMEQFRQHYQDLLSSIEEVSISEQSSYQKAVRKYQICKLYCFHLKPIEKMYLPPQPDDEMAFYKEIKPKMLAELFFWQSRSKWELQLSTLKGKKLKRWVQQRINRMDSYFAHNRKLYSYYLLDRCDKDRKYFSRKEVGSSKSYYHPDLDNESYNPYSIHFARFKANERLMAYLAPLVKKTGPTSPIEFEQSKSQLAWTGTKAQFIEWVYALQSSGSIQHGNVEVKTLFDALGKTFGIDVTHYYGYFQRMRIRKKDRTPYLNLMTEFLIRRMDECDEFPRASTR
jgi:hypothetical protein